MKCKHPSLIILISCLFMHCHTENIQAEKTQEKDHFLNDSIRSCYEEFKHHNVIIGVVDYQTCYDYYENCLHKIQFYSNISELLFMIADTSCQKAFKVFLLSELIQRDKVLGRKVLNHFANDTTLIEHVSSCVGIVFQRSMQDECKLISGDYYLNYMTNDIEKKE